MPIDVKFLLSMLECKSPKTDLTHLRMDKTEFSPAFSRLQRLREENKVESETMCHSTQSKLKLEKENRNNKLITMLKHSTNLY
jgi:hypothetical protein